MFGIVVARRQRPHHVETADAIVPDHTLDTADDHQLRLAAADVLRPFADGLRAGCAGINRCAQRTFRFYQFADVMRGHIGQRRCNAKRAGKAPTFLAKDLEFFVAFVKAANGRANIRADKFLQVFRQDQWQIGILHQLVRRGNRQLRRAAHAARFLEVDPLGRIKALHFAGNARGHILGIE